MQPYGIVCRHSLVIRLLTSFKNMKKQSIFLIQLLFIAVFFTSFAQLAKAQSTVDATEILQRMKSGENISYENVTIVGVMDMTSAKEELPNLPRRKSYKDNQVKSKLSGDIKFVNCTFEDHVYAYFHDKGMDHTDGNSVYTFTVNFDGDVTFKDCTFKERAWFKYSAFEEDSDFSGSQFEGSTTFKYSKFPERTSFANTVFEDDNTFKYTEFSEFVSFENAQFHEDATFKYTKFQDGVSMKNTNFHDDLDFKYTKIRGGFDDTNMVVDGSMNTKYFKHKAK